MVFDRGQIRPVDKIHLKIHFFFFPETFSEFFTGKNVDIHFLLCHFLGFRTFIFINMLHVVPNLSIKISYKLLKIGALFVT